QGSADPRSAVLRGGGRLPAWRQLGGARLHVRARCRAEVVVRLCRHQARAFQLRRRFDPRQRCQPGGWQHRVQLPQRARRPRNQDSRRRCAATHRVPQVRCADRRPCAHRRQCGAGAGCRAGGRYGGAARRCARRRERRAMSVTNGPAILYPMFALAAWTAFVQLLIPLARTRSELRGEIKLSDFEPGESAAVPQRVSIPNRNYMNLLEFPLLLYVGCIVAYVATPVSSVMVTLAWTFVALRVVHS